MLPYCGRQWKDTVFCKEEEYPVRDAFMGGILYKRLQMPGKREDMSK